MARIERLERGLERAVYSDELERVSCAERRG